MDLSREQHTYLPLSADAEVGSLARYQQPGGSVVSINVGYAPHADPEVLSLLAGYRRGITGDPRLALAGSVVDIDAAGRAGPGRRDFRPRGSLGVPWEIKRARAATRR
jgi:membrane dipeptidase